MQGTLACLLAAGLMAALTLMATPAPAATPATTYANAVVKATNAERAQHDLVKLRRNKCLQRFANRQAKRMAAQHRLFHQSLGPIQRRCKVGEVGENVAFGFPTGGSVVDAWMGSSGHRANILNPRFRLIAVGARKGDGQWWVAQVFGVKR